MQRLQRHATYGHLKQLVLRMIAEDVLAETETQAADMLSALRCGQSLSVGMLSLYRCRSIYFVEGARPLRRWARVPRAPTPQPGCETEALGSRQSQ